MSDAGADLGIAIVLELHLVELGEVIDEAAAIGTVEPFGILDVQDRIADGAKLNALIAGGEKARSPETVVKGLIGGVAGTLRHHDHERRQVFVVAAESVGEPRADRGPSGELKAGLEESDRRIVVDRFRVHALDKCKLIGALRQMRQQVTQPRPALPMLFEIVHGGRDGEAGLGGSHAGEALPLADGIW